MSFVLDTLHELFIVPLHQVAYQKALIGGSLVAIVCGVVGCFIILRRMAFLGDALSHSMLAGVVAGYLLMQVLVGEEAHAPAMIVGSILAGLVTVGMIGFISNVSRIKDDTAIGIMYTGIFAVGGVVTSIFQDRIHIHVYDYIVGMLLAISDGHLWMMAFIAAFVISVVILFFRHLQITTFDPVMAASLGISVVGVNYLLTTCTSLVVVGAVSVVGIILVVGLLVTPAATAYLLCDRLSRMLVLSATFGVTSVAGGLYSTIWLGQLGLDVATGAAIVVISTLQFLLVLMIAPRYGIVADRVRRLRAVPQSLVEDVLGALRRAPEQPVPVATVQQSVEGKPRIVRRAIRSLQRQELLELEDNAVKLTETGQREARRLMRAHRLWEAYLAHVGTPADQLHATAHRLEHVHDEETVDYLDDKLGHPLRDPHGSVIPEDFVHLVPGTEVIVSLLREGHRATITKIDAPAQDVSLEVGAAFTTGPRQPDGKHWTLILDDGQQILLDHKQADAVTALLQPPTN